MAVILFNYQQFSNQIPPALLPKKEFEDDGSISEWAKEAVDNLVMQGIITGKPGELFDPKGGATRAEFATVLMRYSDAVTTD